MTTGAFVGRQDELAILTERFAATEMGYPQVVHLEGEAGCGKSTLLSQFLGSVSDAVIVQVGGDEDEMLLSYGVLDQVEAGASTEPAADPMAVGVTLLELLDRLQSGGRVVVLTIDDLQWVDRPSARAMLFALRRLRADKVLTIISSRTGGSADPGWSRFLGGDSRVLKFVWADSSRAISWSWQVPWGWSHLRTEAHHGWPPTPRGTHSTAGPCSTRSALPR